MAKDPKQTKPERSVKDKGKKIQGWLDTGGGKARGRAIIEGSDPRNENVDPEVVGWEGDTPILKPGKQFGTPEIHTGHTAHPDDTSLIGKGIRRPDGSGEWSGAAPVTPDQHAQLIEELYGKQGAIRNNKAADALGVGAGANELLKALIDWYGPQLKQRLGSPKPSIHLPGGTLVTTPSPGLPGHGILTNPLPRSLPSGMINTPFPELPGRGILTNPVPRSGPQTLINVPAGGLAGGGITSAQLTQLRQGGHSGALLKLLERTPARPSARNLAA